MTHTWILTSWTDLRMVQAGAEVVTLEEAGVDHLVLEDQGMRLIDNGKHFL